MHIQPRLLALSLLLSTALALPAFSASAASDAAPSALEMPWETFRGPDKFARVNGPASGIDLDPEKKSVALAIGEFFADREHEGLLGFALHPQFGMGKDHDFVYVATSHDSGTSGAANSRRTRIVQYYWDAEAGRLGDPLELIPEAPALGPVARN